MFGFRNDGKKVKGMNIIDKAEPFFMPQRIDAVNYTPIKILCDPMDEFIARKRKEGEHYSYMYILMAAVARVLYSKPKLNRFIMRGTVYQRNYISISMDVKKKLVEDGEQMTLKFYFTGRESLPEIKNIVETEINKNLDANAVDNTTKAAGKFCKLPDFLFRWALGICRWADKHGMLTKKLINASPFHTSCFLTNLKSIKLGHIFHHLYNFGTTTMFISLGKEKMEPWVENNKELKVKKALTLGFSLDERVADGLYLGQCLRMMQDLLANPDLLMTALPDDGTVPKWLISKPKKKKKTEKKAKDKTKVKEKKPKKIKPLKNKEKHDKKNKKKTDKEQD